MAITLRGSSSDLVGLSTDTKPEEAQVNQIFQELDTGDYYYFDGEDWNKVGGDGE